MQHHNGVEDLPNDSCRLVVDETARKLEYQKYTCKVTSGTKKGENFLGDIYKVEIAGSDGSGALSQTHFILKTASSDMVFRENVPIKRYYLKEIEAYTSILPVLESLQEKLPSERRFKTPKFYAAGTKMGEELLLLGDLCPDGYCLYNKHVSLDTDHVMLSVKNLAWFHATSFVLRLTNPEVFREFTVKIGSGLDYGTNFLFFINMNRGRILKALKGSEHYDKFNDYLQDMPDKLDKFLEPSNSEPYNVICHGDFWTSNIMFKYINGQVDEARLIDWQILRLASPVTDLGYFLFAGTDERLRSHHFHNIFEVYYENLAENIKAMGCDVEKCYPRHVYDSQLKELLPFGLLIAIVLCPLTMCDVDEVTSLEKANDQIQKDADALGELSKTPKERLVGGVRDFFKFKLYPTT